MSDTKTLIVTTDIEKAYPLTKYNRIMPSTRQLASVRPYHTVSIEILTISPKVEDREVFKLATTKINGEWISVYSLTKLALDRIGNVLGVEWIPEQCRRTDDRQDPNVVEFTVAGRIPKIDGLDFTSITGTKQIEVSAYVDEHRYKCEDKIMSKNGWSFGGKTYKSLEDGGCGDALDRSARKRAIDVNKHKLALAESGAKTRAIRSYGLNTTYTEEQLKKPFAVQHLHMDSDAISKDPKAKAAVLQTALGAKGDLFPDVKDAEFSSAIETVDEEKKSDEKTNEPDAATKRAVQEQEFKTFDAETKYEALVRMIEKNNVTVDGKPMNLDRKKFLAKDVDTQLKNMMWTYDKIHPIETAEFPD